jgi:hypothetical protein
MSSLAEYSTEENGMFCILNENISVSVENNFCLIGSPSSEGISRKLFDYEIEQNEELEGYLKDKEGFFELPIKWILDVDHVQYQPEPKIIRPYEHIGRIERPNWGIRVEKDKILWPECDSITNYLVSDYLLITRIPNILSSDALDKGKVIVSVGGAHGTGTRAIENLLRNKKIMEEIGKFLHEKGMPDLIKKKKYFGLQILFKVEISYHKDLTYKSIKIKNLIGDPIIWGINDEIWYSASNEFHKKYGNDETL